DLLVVVGPPVCERVARVVSPLDDLDELAANEIGQSHGHLGGDILQVRRVRKVRQVRPVRQARGVLRSVPNLNTVLEEKTWPGRTMVSGNDGWFGESGKC